MNAKNILKKPWFVLSLVIILLVFFVILFLHNPDIESEIPTQGQLSTAENVSQTESSDMDPTEAANNKITLLVNGIATDIMFSDVNYTMYEAQLLSTEIINEILISDLNGYDVWIDEQKITENEPFLLELDSLSLSSYISIVLTSQSSDETKYFGLRTLPDEINFVHNGTSNDRGFYYFRFSDNIIKMNTNGEVVFYKNTPGVRDFKMYSFDGNTYYAYLDAGTEFEDEKLEDVGYGQQKLVVMDSSYRVIDTLHFISDEAGLPSKHSLDSHDFIMLDVGHYIVSSYVGKTVTNIPTTVDDDGKSTVVAAIIQEIKDDELIFQWDSTDYPELYEMSVENNNFNNPKDFFLDYAHFNSIEIDPTDNNYVVSFRNLDAVIKIDSVSGDIIWTLGGKFDDFNLTQEEKFSRQHDARFVEDGKLTIFDNGVINLQSRVLQMNLDQDNLTVNSYESFMLPGYYSPSMGSAQRLSYGENTFVVGWGNSKTGNNVVWSEVNFATGKVVMELYDVIQSDQVDNTYRVYKFPQ